MAKMTRKHRQTTNELIKSVSHMLKSQVEKLYQSGGIDPSAYSGGEYTLARILISAALTHIARDIEPLHLDNRKAVTNLSHF
jgi:hypothetical protein